jgi:Conserved protein/domain typically associated with flavoprotein oxygenases, DIM6/NTAB family
MEFVKYQLTDGHLNGAHHRFIQPPQVAYFVSTVDQFGNVNITPTTMGTAIGHNFFSFTLSNLFEENWDQRKYNYRDGIKQGYCNLEETPECVISYYGHNLLRESWIAGMPIPKGISEIDVMGLTALPSEQVKPAGIAECPINLEAKVLHKNYLGKRWVNYICEVVGVTVHKELDERNRREPYAGYGVMLIDPILEIFIGKGGTPETDNIRLVYDRLDWDKIERCPEEIGCKEEWIGTFKQWMHDEQARGNVTQEDVERLFTLESKWAANRDPIANADVKKELTQLIKKVVSKK